MVKPYSSASEYDFLYWRQSIKMKSNFLNRRHLSLKSCPKRWHGETATWRQRTREITASQEMSTAVDKTQEARWDALVSYSPQRETALLESLTWNSAPELWANAIPLILSFLDCVLCCGSLWTWSFRLESRTRTVQSFLHQLLKPEEINSHTVPQLLFFSSPSLRR